MRRFLKSVAGSYFDDDESRTEDKVLVQHGKDTLDILFPKGDVSSKTTVKDLRIGVQDALGLSHDHSVKLVFAGQHLKDEDAPLSSYKVKHGSKILCMASKSKLNIPNPSSTSSSAGSNKPQEQAKPKVIPPMEKIELVKKHIANSVMPLVAGFEANPPEDVNRRKEEHHRLSETVLGEMLKLDSVDVDGPDGADVRKKRKETVRELHSLLERLDKVDKH